jgi:hypothetical protein
LVVPEFFGTIERNGLSTWIRESPSLFAFYFILLLHTVGLSLVVGANVVVDLRILGVASGLPLKPLKQLFGIMWVGLGINGATGMLLLIAYPTKSLTNPLFYAKLSLIGFAVIIMQRINARVFGNASLSEASMVARGKTMAMWSLALWAGAIAAGRLLAETFKYLTYADILKGKANL